jgi:hypothetical protein
MKFEFKNPNTGEKKTVNIDDAMIRMQLEEFAYEKLCECQPVGETNVIECECAEYYEDFELQPAP